MKILFLTQVLPYPLDSGSKIRAYYVLRRLVEAKHQVTLLSFTRSTDGPDHVAHLRSLCDAVYTVPMKRSRLRDGWHLVQSLSSRTPMLIARDWMPAMVQQIQELVAAPPPFDVIHADQLWMARYALLARSWARGEHRPALVLDQHDAVFQIPYRLAEHEANPLKRAGLVREGHKLARYQQAVVQQFDRVVWVTAEDEAALRARSTSGGRARLSNGQSSVIPICTEPGPHPPKRLPHPRRVTFLGGLHWPPNAKGITWFARDIWPAVAAQVPDAVLTIIGKQPPAELLQLSAAAQAAGRGSIEVTGYVSDLTPYLADTAVFIVPLQAGGGMRVKILDAWSWGLPIVTTQIGGEGMCVQHDHNALLADSVGDFARAVVRVLQDPALGERLASAGRETVETYYDWRTVYRAWDQVYRLDS